MRLLSASAVDHCAPSVVTAIAKYHMTELMRRQSDYYGAHADDELLD